MSKKEYIDKEAFRQELISTPFYPRCKTTPDLLTSVQDRLNDTIELLDNFPAADVKPVVRGQWLSWEEMFPDSKPRRKNNLGVFCSVCQKHADTPDEFCHRCGADMRGEQQCRTEVLGDG